MSPQPTGRYGLIRIPAPGATGVWIRYAALLDRDEFNPPAWPSIALTPSATYAGWWEFDIDARALPDGTYEYERRFVGPEEAVGAAISYSSNVSATHGLTRRVIITDGGDCVNWEWRFGEGVVFPPPAPAPTHTA